MSDSPEQIAAARLLGEAQAIAQRADEGAAQSLYDDIIDLMTAADMDRSTMFLVMCMAIGSWVSPIDCKGCRMVEIGRMSLLAKAMSDVMTKQTDGGDDAESHHATRH